MPPLRRWRSGSRLASAPTDRRGSRRCWEQAPSSWYVGLPCVRWLAEVRPARTSARPAAIALQIQGEGLIRNPDDGVVPRSARAPAPTGNPAGRRPRDPAVRGKSANSANCANSGGAGGAGRVAATRSSRPTERGSHRVRNREFARRARRARRPDQPVPEPAPAMTQLGHRQRWRLRGSPHYLMRGSRTSRRPSPRRLSPSTTTTMATPGTVVTQWFCNM